MRHRSFARSVLLPAEGWLSFVFLCAVALSSVWSVQAAGWVDNLNILTWVTLLAIVCGFLLAKTRMPGILSHPIGLLFGLATVTYSVASTISSHSLKQNVVELWDRLEHWVNVTASGGISTDNLLFLLLLAVIIWLMGYYGAYSVFRARGPWWVILTSGSVLVVNLSYARTLDMFALFYLLAAMLLVMRLNVAIQEDAWRRSDIQYSSDFGWQLVRSSVVVAVVVVLATWAVPSSAASQQLADAWTTVSGPWQGAEAEFSRLFGGLRAKDQAMSSGFGSTLALRGATALGDTPVLAISGDNPLYLRGVVYDRYTGQGWLAPEWGSEQLVPNDPRLDHSGNLLLREEITTTIKVLQPRGMTVLTPAQPVRISLPVTAEYQAHDQAGGNGQAAGEVVDVSVMRSSAMLRRGQQYVVVSSVSSADEKSLRGAGTQYPEWVRQQYLSGFRSVPRRVLSLARRVTRGFDNPYDKAMALQSFLRTYPYSSTVPQPPPGRDAVDYFLFDARIGYCDYYASAMVIMLRSLGIPARVVSGYSPGDYDPSLQATIVRDSNAHSWPEVYFPSYGWIDFEPTASRPLPSRPEVSPAAEVTAVPDQADALKNLDPTPTTPDQKETGSTPLAELSGVGNLVIASGRIIVPVLVLLLLIYVVFRILWTRALRGLQPSEEAYAKMARLAGWAGLGRLPYQTPHEYGRRLVTVVPEGNHDVELIVERFMRQRFGRKTLSPTEEAGLADAWRRLRGHLLRLAVRRMRAVRRQSLSAGSRAVYRVGHRPLIGGRR